MNQFPEKRGTLEAYEGEVELRDGSRVYLRPITPEDEVRLLRFFRSLSEESRRLRFFAVTKDSILVKEAHKEASVDCAKAFGLIALAENGERIVGHAICSKLPAGHAEAAFAVTDDYRGRGLGTILLSRVAQAAAAGGVIVLEAEVMAENQPMLDVFRHSGFKVTATVEQGQVHIEVPLSAQEPASACVRLPDLP